MNLPDKPLKIGITGGIGTGKSIVCKIFELLGIPIYDADARAKWLLTHDVELIKQIRQHFGENVYLSVNDNQLNKKILSDRIYKNPNQLDLLNSLVHPKVMDDYEKWQKNNIHHPYIIKEAALLYESGSYQYLDKIITVYAPVSLRIERILKRDPHRTESDVKAIMAAQISDEQKVKKADYVIYNDDKKMVIPQVLELHKKFTSTK
ncbi:MAG: dephospho-CoA kinase [Cytophagales bacterium]|nr:dephospho-CoA kinase [Cytophagales bacterium]